MGTIRRSCIIFGMIFQWRLLKHPNCASLRSLRRSTMSLSHIYSQPKKMAAIRARVKTVVLADCRCGQHGLVARSSAAQTIQNVATHGPLVPQIQRPKHLQFHPMGNCLAKMLATKFASLRAVSVHIFNVDRSPKKTKSHHVRAFHLIGIQKRLRSRRL